jgi:tRNA (guanine-N7-)-methyltransferase
MSIGQKPHGPLRSYGRVKARQLKSRQAGLIEANLPRLSLPEPSLGPIDPDALAPGFYETWLEIGFGGGEHMAEQAARHPHVRIFGAEPFLNGAASAVRYIDERGLENIRILQGDGRELLAALPPTSIARIFILFPDPWPKTRHHKRRLINEDVIAALARVLKPGGQLRFATDWADYAHWTLQRFNRSPDFRWTAEAARDWTVPPADHVTTRYEEKALGDCAPVFLDFERV